eukprot:525880-Amphidinium_carterae.1
MCLEERPLPAFVHQAASTNPFTGYKIPARDVKPDLLTMETPLVITRTFARDCLLSYDNDECTDSGMSAVHRGGRSTVRTLQASSSSHTHGTRIGEWALSLHELVTVTCVHCVEVRVANRHDRPSNASRILM